VVVVVVQDNPRAVAATVTELTKTNMIRFKSLAMTRTLEREYNGSLRARYQAGEDHTGRRIIIPPVYNQ
jgi:hypothetical protein